MLGADRERALLFKKLATLRTDAPLFDDVDLLRYAGAGESFAAVAVQIGDPKLAGRVAKIASAAAS